MSAFEFAFLANVKIMTDNTFIPNSDYWWSSAFIASHVSMDRLLVNFRNLLSFWFFHVLFNNGLSLERFRFFFLKDFLFYFAFWNNFFFNLGNQIWHNFAKFLRYWLINTLLLRKDNTRSFRILMLNLNNFWGFYFRDGLLLSLKLLIKVFLNNDLLSCIIKIFRAFLNFNPDLLHPRLVENLDISIV